MDFKSLLLQACFLLFISEATVSQYYGSQMGQMGSIMGRPMVYPGGMVQPSMHMMQMSPMGQQPRMVPQMQRHQITENSETTNEKKSKKHSKKHKKHGKKHKKVVLRTKKKSKHKRSSSSSSSKSYKSSKTSSCSSESYRRYKKSKHHHHAYHNMKINERAPYQSEVLTPILSYVAKNGDVIYQKKLKNANSEKLLLS